jgi:hypothetical protein
MGCDIYFDAKTYYNPLNSEFLVQFQYLGIKIREMLRKTILFMPFMFLGVFLSAQGFYGSEPEPVKKGLSDAQLLEEVQRVTFRYFWDFADPTSGLARERSNTNTGYGHEVITSGGSGFGIMAIIVAVERKWITREQGVERLLKIVNYLRKNADSFHGMFRTGGMRSRGGQSPFHARMMEEILSNLHLCFRDFSVSLSILTVIHQRKGSLGTKLISLGVKQNGTGTLVAEEKYCTGTGAPIMDGLWTLKYVDITNAFSHTY